MEVEKMLQKLSDLPQDAQQEANDFIDFLLLRYRYSPSCSSSSQSHRSLMDEPFVGMWKDREDMQDSNAWLRKVRHQEWNQKT